MIEKAQVALGNIARATEQYLVCCDRYMSLFQYNWYVISFSGEIPIVL